MWLLESWEIPDFDQWADGQRAAPLPEGVIFGHQEHRPEQVQRLLDENPSLRFLDYFNPWTYPESEWVNRGNTWFDYMNSLLSRFGLLWIDPQTKVQAITPPPDRDVLVRFDQKVKACAPDLLARYAIDARELVATRPNRSFYLDQFFPDGLEQWMADSLGGHFSAERCYPYQADHCAVLRGLVKELAGAGPVLTGGSGYHQDPGTGLASRYFEGTGDFAANPWDKVLPAWKLNPGNVLSVLAESTSNVQRAIAEWRAWGGWLAFTTQVSGDAGTAFVRDAYQMAAAAREDALR